MKVKLLKENKYKNLNPKMIYEVIGIEGDDFRIINNDNEPCLYSLKLFRIVNKKEPEFWVNEFGEGGERHSYPKAINTPGFFDAFFNGDKKTNNNFETILKKHYPVTFLKYAETKQVMNYFRMYHKNLFRIDPWYEFHLKKITDKSIFIELHFKKKNVYCCTEPHCHLTYIHWDKLGIKRIKYFNVKIICEKGSYIKIENKLIKNNYHITNVKYARN
jgi:hypothetical protein